MRFHGRIIASAGAIWRAVLIEAGRSDNGDVYDASMLRRAAAAGVFEGRPCKVFPVMDADGRPLSLDGAPFTNHVGPDALARVSLANAVGIFKETSWDEQLQSVVGNLHLFDVAASPLVELVRRQLEALEATNGLTAVGLSIDGEADPGPELRVIHSVDVVSRPAAGGRVLHRIAASRNTPVKLLDILRGKCPRLFESYKGDESLSAIGKHAIARVKENADAAGEVATVFKVDSKRVTEMAPMEFLEGIEKLCADARATIAGEEAKVAEAARAAEAARLAAAAKPAPTPEPKELDEVRKELKDLRIERSRTRLTEACRTAGLPDKVREHVLAEHAGRELSEDDCKRIAESNRKVVDSLIGSASLSRTQVVREPRDRAVEALAHMLSPRCPKPKEGVEELRGSIHRAFRLFAGIDVRDAVDMASRRRMRESIDATQFNDAFADALNRAFIAEYKGDEAFTQGWRSISNIVPVSDFRTYEAEAMTYYGFLPEVAERAPYQALSTPTDRKESYAVTKRGGTEDISWEKLRNDDLGVWQRANRLLALAARQTLSDVVFKVIRKATQPTMSDGKKLTDATRAEANEGTSVLSGDAAGWTAFVNTVTAFMKRKNGAGQPLNIRPRNLVIPYDLVKVAGQLFSEFSPGATDIPTRRGLEILKVVLPNVVIDPGATDATDWFLLADPSEAEVIRVAFLDGREDPEIFFDQNETIGGLFERDVVTLKIRHVYAAKGVDYMGAYGQVQ